MDTITPAETAAGPELPADAETPPLAETPPAAAPPPVADGVERQLDPRYVALERVTGWVGTGVTALVFLIALGLMLLLAPVPGWATAPLLLLWGAATAGLGWLSHRWPEIDYRHAWYAVDDRALRIRRGVVWRSAITVPRSRVQHIDVSQGPFERRYGLGTLVVYTAGTDYARVDLRGLDHATALRIRDHLLPGESGDAV